jgi:hypothetical protein
LQPLFYQHEARPRCVAAVDSGQQKVYRELNAPRPAVAYSLSADSTFLLATYKRHAQCDWEKQIRLLNGQKTV